MEIDADAKESLGNEGQTKDDESAADAKESVGNEGQTKDEEMPQAPSHEPVVDAQKALRLAAGRLVMATGVPAFARMGVRLNLGGVIKCRKYLLSLVQKDANAARAAVKVFNENSNPAARKLKEFRDEPALYAVEQDFVNAKADADGEPRPEQKPTATGGCAAGASGAIS